VAGGAIVKPAIRRKPERLLGHVTAAMHTIVFAMILILIFTPRWVWWA
jgi:hypothetical protein